MVETIAPVGYGKRRDYLVAVALHVAAATVVGAAFGAIAAALGGSAGAPWGWVGAVVVIGAGLLYAARELVGLPIPLFDRKRQVPDWWRTFYGGRTTAVLYGAGLGIGFATYLRHGTYVVVIATAIASGNPAVGALLGASFGFARGLTALVSAAGANEEDAWATVTRLERLAVRRYIPVANGIACLAIAGASLAALV